MKYMLIFQWLMILEFDVIEDLEDGLEVALPATRDIVDGHDCGSGETNIFIVTDAPREAFEESMGVIRSRGLGESVRAAFRKLDDEDFEVLWPVSLQSFSVI